MLVNAGSSQTHPQNAFLPVILKQHDVASQQQIKKYGKRQASVDQKDVDPFLSKFKKKNRTPTNVMVDAPGQSISRETVIPRLGNVLQEYFPKANKALHWGSGSRKVHGAKQRASATCTALPLKSSSR